MRTAIWWYTVRGRSIIDPRCELVGARLRRGKMYIKLIFVRVVSRAWPYQDSEAPDAVAQGALNVRICDRCASRCRLKGSSPVWRDHESEQRGWGILF